VEEIRVKPLPNSLAAVLVLCDDNAGPAKIPTDLNKELPGPAKKAD
jgi:hypothetical protein